MRLKPKSRKENIVMQELEKEILIYDLKINKVFSLNETCAMVWVECDGNKTITEIASTLSQRTNGLVNEEVVWFALDTLQKENLLDESFEMNSKFKGMNRRDVIRKVGFASMVAIPLVTSLYAPIAANAQSNSPVPCGSHNPGETWTIVNSITVSSPAPALCPSVCNDPAPAQLTDCQDVVPQPIADPDFHEVTCVYFCPA